MTDLAAEVAALRAEVEDMKSREAIRQQITRYGRGQEWLDVSLMHEVFWPDAHVDFGFFKGTWEDYAPVLMEIEAGPETTYHFCGSPQIELDGDTAYVEVYGIAGGRRDGHTHIYGGRYIERFERRNGEWRIADCRYTLDWDMGAEDPEVVGGEHPELEHINPRSPEHPLFRRMGMDVTG